MGKRYTAEVRAEVLGKIEKGRKVRDVANEHGINEFTVRSWLEREAAGRGSEILELSRLKRENEALLRIIGQLTYEAEMEKKNRRRERRR